MNLEGKRIIIIKNLQGITIDTTIPSDMNKLESVMEENKDG